MIGQFKNCHSQLFDFFFHSCFFPFFFTQGFYFYLLCHVLFVSSY